MIGNDIVDREQARRESNWQRRGFLNKLFTPSEQQLIQNASDPECMVWLLWSMKESAYKATTRKTGRRAFNPTKISCLLEVWSGEVAEGLVFYEEEYRTKSLITPEYIASTASPALELPAPKQVIVLLEHTDYQYQSIQLRISIQENYNAISPVLSEELQVGHDEYGSPILVIKNSLREVINVPISISHHGHYGAFCLAYSARLIPKDQHQNSTLLRAAD